MIKRLKNIILACSMIMVAAAPVALVSSAAASTVNIDQSVCGGTGFNLSGNGGNCSSVGESGFQSLLDKVVNIFSAIVGIIAVIMIIVGGLRYITSGGDSSRVGAAKTTIIYALVGLVVVVLAQLIVHFVINQATGLNGSSGQGG
jgi:cytochrome bd-type quinol oxidase subunit 2